MKLTVDLSPERDEDATQLDDETGQLQRELSELDVDDVRRVGGGSPPPGARAIDATLLGSLAVTAGREVIGAVVGLLVQWIGRRSNRTVRLTIGDDSIELSDVSADDQRRLVESFLARHAAEA